MDSKPKKSPAGLYVLAAAAVIALDRLTKVWVRAHIPLDPSASEEIPLIPGVVHLSHIRNEGVAFGMLQGGRWAFVALLGVFCALVLWALCTGKLTASWERWLAVLAMGGALSNGIDRAVYGYVTDIKVQDNGIKIYFTKLNAFPQQILIDIAAELCIGGARAFNELSRTHWAIKRVNLVEELAKAGCRVFKL